MNPIKKLRSWCPQPKKSAPIRFSAISQHWKSKLLYAIPVTVLVAAIFISLPLLLRSETDGWPYSREVDRINFPGGAIIVHENSQSPTDKAYITISIQANIFSEENLAAYVESRTNALNNLLETVSDNTTIEAIITFKEPVSPQNFAVLCENSIEKPGEYAITLINENTSTTSPAVLWFPRPQETNFPENLTHTLEGAKLEGIIAFECYIKSAAAKSLLSDPKILLIDPFEDPQVTSIKKDYELKGFDVQVSRAFFGEMWTQYVTLLK